MNLFPYDNPTSMDELVRCYEYAGGHFFEPGTMRFFGSRICPATMTRVRPGVYLFITSEQRPRSSDPRAYTVRMMCFEEYIRESDGRRKLRATINTVGDFQQHRTRKQAVSALKAALAAAHEDELQSRVAVAEVAAMEGT